MLTLSNRHLQIALDPTLSGWSLQCLTAERPVMRHGRLSGSFLLSDSLWGAKRLTWEGAFGEAFEKRSTPTSPQGPLESLVFRTQAHSLELIVEFALPAERPFALGRMQARNSGVRPIRVAHLDFLSAEPGDETVEFSSPPQALTFFANGWQSWSFAGALTARQIQPHTFLGPIQGPPNHNPATPYHRAPGRFSSDMFAVLADPRARQAVVVGFLSQREQFGSVAARLDQPAATMHVRAQCDQALLPAGATLTTDWAYFQLLTNYDDDPLREYAEAVAREHAVQLPATTPAGWCSWYQYFNKVTEANVRHNIARLAQNVERLPLTLAQLDDGFQANVGDWFQTNAKFPSGLKALAASMRAQHLTPGVWLAPFAARPDSQLAQQHPDWLVRGRVGCPANAGFVFGTFSRGLDITHPAVQDHTRRLISTAVYEWGFPYLKLDFLYAAALVGRRHDPTYTRAQAMRLGLQIIREAAGPQTFLLGCGCPLGSAVGLVEALRISADVDGRWRPSYQGQGFLFKDEPAMPAARNAIRNSLTRAPLHRRWWINDPDCVLVRDTTALTPAEITALLTVVALSGGMFFVSDDLNQLTPEQIQRVATLFPVLGHTAQARDWLTQTMPEQHVLPLNGPLGAWTVAGLFNWGEQAADRVLPIPAGVATHVFDFWNQTYQRANGEVVLSALPPHGARLFALRPLTPPPQYIGSSFHFSQGGEVERWEVRDRALTLALTLGRVADGQVTLALPAAPRNHPATPLPNAAGLYHIPLHINRRAELTLEW